MEVQKGIKAKLNLAGWYNRPLNVLDKESVEAAQTELIVKSFDRVIAEFTEATGRHPSEILCEGRYKNLLVAAYNAQEKAKGKSRTYWCNDRIEYEGVKITESCKLEGTTCIVQAWDGQPSHPC